MRDLPELFDLGVKARSLAYLFLAGAGLGLLTLVFPHSDVIQDRELVILALFAIAMSAVMYALADRLRPLHLHAFLGLGTIVLSLANYFVEATVLYPLLYTWTALYAFYFFQLRQALAHVAFIGICYAIVLAIVDPPSAVVRWLLAVGTPLVAGLLISRLLRRLRAEGVSADERARELQRSEARTRLVLDSAPDAFVAIDGDGVVTSWNAASERMFGWSAAEAMGQPIRNLIFPPGERDAYDDRRSALLEAPETVRVMRVESILQRRDGSVFPVERTISRVRVGDEVMMTAFMRDITDRKRADEEREQLVREQVARAEAERTAEMVSGMQLLVDAALAHRTLNDILEDLVVRVRGVLDADAATIFVAEGGHLRIGASSGGDPTAEDPGPIPFGRYFAGRVALSQEPLLSQNPDPNDLADPAVRGLPLDSLIGVPLKAEGEVAGVLVVCATAPHHFGEEDLTLLRLAADRVALAILHARVYEREHKIAETLQRSLLPESLPSLPGLEAAARYLPAAAEAEVGGDWYDVIPLARGRVGLVMGDVAGKGLAAASMVGRLRSALRAYALENHDPATVVEQLNRLVWTEANETQMATLLYAVVDPAESAVRWVNAGHPALLLLDPDEPAPRFLEGGSSVPLGVLPFPNYEEMSARLAPGATLLLFTDGLVERPGELIDRGMERVAAAMGDGPVDAEPLLDHLVGTLVPAGGTPDDVALLALRSLPVSDRFRIEFPTEPESLASMRSLLRRWLGYADGDERVIAEITTACGEAATNAIEHAGAGGPFEVAGRVDGREVEITVRDRGTWRVEREGDHGRGLALMRALMDSVEVTPTMDGTMVRLRRALDS